MHITPNVDSSTTVLKTWKQVGHAVPYALRVDSGGSDMTTDYDRLLNTVGRYSWTEDPARNRSNSAENVSARCRKQWAFCSSSHVNFFFYWIQIDGLISPRNSLLQPNVGGSDLNSRSVASGTRYKFNGCSHSSMTWTGGGRLQSCSIVCDAMPICHADGAIHCTLGQMAVLLQHLQPF